MKDILDNGNNQFCDDVNYSGKMLQVKKVLLLIVSWTLAIIALLFVAFGLAYGVIEMIITNKYLGFEFLHTEFTNSEWFSFTASYLGAIGSVFIGSIALYQNKKYKEESDKFNKKISEYNNKISSLNQQRTNEMYDYQKKMDELILLAEIFPQSVTYAYQGKFTMNLENSVVYKFYDNQLKNSERLYIFEFIMSRNPIIDFHIYKIIITYKYNEKEDEIISNLDLGREYKLAFGKVKNYLREDEKLNYGIILPNTGYELSEVDTPIRIDILMTIRYKNIYNMQIEKEISCSLNEEVSRIFMGYDAYPTWDIEKAKIIDGYK